ncbi:MAG: T9SS type A sorting domain-containing protein [Flavobacteriales bacterium]
MLKKFTLPVLVLAFTVPSYAQLSFGGQPYGDKAEKRGMPPAIAVHLPAVDVATLMQEDADRAAQGIKGPFRFGFEHLTDYTLANSGSWFTMPNGDRVWRLILHCPGALGINLQMSNFVIPEGARLFLYNAEGTVRGAFTAKSNPGHTEFGTAPLKGDAITVEYIEPAALAGQGQLTISGVVHEYRVLGGGMNADGSNRGYGDSGSCNVNTVCPEGDLWRDEIRSVAHVILGGGVCTGTLLNNCANDSTPYFLTANHCTEGNETNASWVFVFNWESPVCDPTENAPMDHSITGCDKLLENSPTDAAFLLLSSIPPVDYIPYYSGWDKSGTPPDSVHCIHHPSGDIKKISSSHAAPFDQQNLDVGNGPADCWHIPEWNSGTTEPGSSGSGLWDQNHRIIGQLYGGQASCSNNVNDYFGRFDLTYPLIEEWLGACGDTLNGFDPDAYIPVPLDASITSIANVPHTVCDADSILPVVTMKNNGEGDITYATINFTVDGIATGSIPWYGVIQPLQTVNIPLPVMHLAAGVHELKVFSSSPNLEFDTNPLNDADSLLFMVNNPGIEAIVHLELDRFGTETTWSIETQDGFTAFTGGPYVNSPDGYTVDEHVCLTHDCYVFTINDAVGDGICCDYGEGAFQIQDTTGAVLLDGYPEFEFSQSSPFCMNWVGVEEAVSAEMRIWPNPNNGVFNVAFGDGAAPRSLSVRDALGRVVWTGNAPLGTGRLQVDLRNVSNGAYVLIAEGNGQRAVQRLVVQR